MQKRILNFEGDYNKLESNNSQLSKEFEALKEHNRKVEQQNDDIERSNRILSATVDDLESMLNQAYEKNEFLELEVEGKESLSERHQRVLDELRGLCLCLSLGIDPETIQLIHFSDLKQEIKVKNQPLNPNQPETRKSFIASPSPLPSHFRSFSIFPDSENVMNGNTPPIASQKAFSIIADSLRRIDVSRGVPSRRTCAVPKFVRLANILS